MSESASRHVPPLLDDETVGRIRVGMDGWRSVLDNLKTLLKPRPRQEELAVVRAILSGPDDRYTRLLKQIASAQFVIRRRPTRSSYALILPGTVEDLIVNLDEPVVSEALEFRDGVSGTDLLFVAFVGEGGIFSHLEGRTADGSDWPKRWSVPPDVQAARVEPLLSLPDIEAVRAREESQRQELANWLRIPKRTLSSLQPHEAASPAEVDAFAEAQSALLPREFRELLLISDGVRMADLELLGTKGAYRLDIPDTDHLVISWVQGESDDAVLTLARSGGNETVYRMDIHDADHTSRPVASGVRDLIRRVLNDGFKSAVDVP